MMEVPDGWRRPHLKQPLDGPDGPRTRQRGSSGLKSTTGASRGASSPRNGPRRTQGGLYNDFQVSDPIGSAAGNFWAFHSVFGEIPARTATLVAVLKLATKVLQQRGYDIGWVCECRSAWAARGARRRVGVARRARWRVIRDSRFVIVRSRMCDIESRAHQRTEQRPTRARSNGPRTARRCARAVGVPYAPGLG